MLWLTVTGYGFAGRCLWQPSGQHLIAAYGPLSCRCPHPSDGLAVHVLWCWRMRACWGTPGLPIRWLLACSYHSLGGLWLSFGLPRLIEMRSTRKHPVASQTVAGRPRSPLAAGSSREATVPPSPCPGAPVPRAVPAALWSWCPLQLSDAGSASRFSRATPALLLH